VPVALDSAKGLFVTCISPVKAEAGVGTT